MNYESIEQNRDKKFRHIKRNPKENSLRVPF